MKIFKEFPNQLPEFKYLNGIESPKDLKFLGDTKKKRELFISKKALMENMI